VIGSEEVVVAARIAQVTLDTTNVNRLAEFWSQALGYRSEAGDDGSAKLYPPDGAGPEVPSIWLQNVAEPKQGKLRLHLDLRPSDGDVAGEVERLLALGARHADVGQAPDDPFVVLADPEGHEFCVLRTEPR
jgi:glyoxalase superfamily protein